MANPRNVQLDGNGRLLIPASIRHQAKLFDFEKDVLPLLGEEVTALFQNLNRPPLNIEKVGDSIEISLYVSPLTQNGIPRIIDALGRVVIPREWRTCLKWDAETILLLDYVKASSKLILRKVVPAKA